MPRKSNVPDINKVRKLHYDLIQKSKPQPDGYVIRGAYNQPIPIRKDGYYRFESNGNDGFCLRVSRLARDWPVFSLAVQLSAYANAWVAYAKLWLKAHGHGDVKIIYCDGYTQPGQYDFNDSQAELRRQITVDFLDPSNNGKPMHMWKGIRQEKSEACDWLGFIDYGVKG